MKAMLFGLVVLCGGSAWACGGPECTDVATPLLGSTAIINAAFEDPVAGPQQPFAFFDAFLIVGSKPWLRQLSDEQVDRVSLSHFVAAIRIRDFPAAHFAAQELVDSILNMSGKNASLNQSELQRAIEYLELEPAIAGLSENNLVSWFIERNVTIELPAELKEAQHIAKSTRSEFWSILSQNPKSLRAPSLRLAMLREEVRTSIPNGWRTEIEIPKSTWDAMEAKYDRWLKDYPFHPLRDFVTLEKMRLSYLRQDSSKCWNVLFDFYQRRPVRAVWEMRFLLRQGLVPKVTFDQLHKIDPVLVMAFLPQLAPTEWDKVWKFSATQPAAVATFLQQGLFWLIIQGLRPKSLTEEWLNQKPKNPNERWAQFRVAALEKEQHIDQAIAQAALLNESEPTSAELVSHLRVVQKKWRDAVLPAGLSPSIVQYLLNIVVPEADLEEIAQSESARSVEAALALAVRRLNTDGWAKGAELLKKKDPQRASLWESAARFEKKDLLEFAQWMFSDGDALFVSVSPGFSRGLKTRWDVISKHEELRVPGVAEEKQRIEAFLLQGGHRQQTLQIYARLLEKGTLRGAKAHAVLKEADRVYNSLMNWDANWVQSYSTLLAESSAAKSIRNAGVLIRKSK